MSGISGLQVQVFGPRQVKCRRDIFAFGAKNKNLSGRSGIRARGHSTFLWMCAGFQNVGSRERIFLEKLGSWERKFGKILV